MYRVKLTEFEGPLDLLLFFLKREELSIENIPIARITNEFVEYLHLMVSLDLEVAGEFIVMAATLMQIKVRMLLPREEGEEEEEDPRAELVRRLIEYKRYKEMSHHLGRREEEQRRLFYRKFFSADTRVVEQEAEEEAMKDVTLFNLIAAYKSALDHMPKRFIHEVALLPVSVDEQTSFVADYLRVHGPSRFLAVVRHMTEKIRIVVTVVALLEMTKNRLVTLRPVESGDDILITPVAPVLPFMTVPSSAA